MINSLPNRPLYLHEITALKRSSKINNAEGLFYENNNINGAICFFLNINETGYILVFDSDNSTWVKLSKINDDSKEKEYDSETDSVIEWIEERYDDYGIYGMEKEQ